jgi:hypothetical protein
MTWPSPSSAARRHSPRCSSHGSPGSRRHRCRGRDGEVVKSVTRNKWFRTRKPVLRSPFALSLIRHSRSNWDAPGNTPTMRALASAVLHKSETHARQQSRLSLTLLASLGAGTRLTVAVRARRATGMDERRTNTNGLPISRTSVWSSGNTPAARASSSSASCSSTYLQLARPRGDAGIHRPSLARTTSSPA